MDKDDIWALLARSGHDGSSVMAQCRAETELGWSVTVVRGVG